MFTAGPRGQTTSAIMVAQTANAILEEIKENGDIETVISNSLLGG